MVRAIHRQTCSTWLQGEGRLAQRLTATVESHALLRTLQPGTPHLQRAASRLQAHLLHCLQSCRRLKVQHRQLCQDAAAGLTILAWEAHRQNPLNSSKSTGSCNNVQPPLQKKLSTLLALHVLAAQNLAAG